MAHLIVVLLICGGLGWISGSPGIAYLAMCAELTVSFSHAVTWHKETVLGRFSDWLHPQVLAFFLVAGLLAINYVTPIFDAPWFWLFGAGIAMAIGGASYFWHLSVHPAGTSRRDHDEAFGHRAMAIAVLGLAIIAAFFARSFPLIAIRL